MLHHKAAWLLLLPVLLADMLPLAVAHHSRSAFDLNSTVAVEGRVTEVSWTNPHYYFSINGAVDEAGAATQEWTFEGHSVPGLVRNGWSRHTLQIGQRVRVVANPNKQDNVHFALLDHVTRADGKTFYSFRKPAGAAPPEQAPLQPSTDFSGTWRLIRSLRNNLIGGIAPPADWPLTEAAQAEVATFDINEDPSLQCQPRGLPRMLAWPYAQRWQFDEQGLQIEVEHSTEHRRVERANNPQRDAYGDNGYAYGGLQADGSFVINSSHFPAKHWGSARGISSGTGKRLRERYELLDDGFRMKVSYELSDPEFLQQPVTVTHEYAKIHDFEFAPEPECDVATAQRHLRYE